jgi:hypothetical protein
MSINFSKKMPTIVQDSGDRNLNFALGRKYYLKVVSKQNINNNNITNSLGNPIKQIDSSLRTQQLRLQNVGSGSMNLKNNKDYINLFGNNNDINYVNHRLSRTRAGGAIAPKK